MQPEVCFLRWRPPNRKYLYLSFQTRYQRRSNGKPPIFGDQQPNGTLANSARCNRKSVFKDGGRQTGSTYISASRKDINAVPTANPPLSGSSNPMELLRIVPDATGSRFLKMAAAKPEVLISQLLDQIATPFQRLTHHFRGPAAQWPYCEYCLM